jgi:hypothetical protein
MASITWLVCAGLAGEGDHKGGFQLVHHALGKAKRVHDHFAITQEFKKIDAAERRRILVLPAAGQIQIDTFDLVGQMSDVVAGQWQIEIGAVGLDQCHYKGGG